MRAGQSISIPPAIVRGARPTGLPGQPYQYAEWKQRRLDYHVEAGAPRPGQTEARVRTDEVFHKAKRVTCAVPGTGATPPWPHMPSSHRTNWTPERIYGILIDVIRARQTPSRTGLPLLYRHPSPRQDPWRRTAGSGLRTGHARHVLFLSRNNLERRAPRRPRTDRRSILKHPCINWTSTEETSCCNIPPSTNSGISSCTAWPALSPRQSPGRRTRPWPMAGLLLDRDDLQARPPAPSRGLYRGCRLPDFPTPRPLFQQLARGKWIAGKQNLIVTVLAASANHGSPACSARRPAASFSVLYKRVPRMFAELGARRRTLPPPVPCSHQGDDWGPDRLSADQRRDLMENVEDRYQNAAIDHQPTARRQMARRIGEPTFADAILDRIATTRTG